MLAAASTIFRLMQTLLSNCWPVLCGAGGGLAPAPPDSLGQNGGTFGRINHSLRSLRQAGLRQTGLPWAEIDSIGILNFCRLTVDRQYRQAELL